MPRSLPRSRAPVGALLLIDVINGFDFPGSNAIVRAATKAAPKIEALANRARARKVPVLYVNDNFGQWRSDFESIVDACTAPDQPGRAVAARLRPHDGDYFVLKPRHSGFYATPLDLLLGHLKVRSVAIAGFAANLCVMFTANDAYMHGYHVVVPSDCTAANTTELTRVTLKQIQHSLKGQVVPAARVRFR